MYEAFFGLSQAPFSLTPDTGRFVNLASHARGLDLLQYAVRSNEGFIKLTGDVGTGKTLLCRRFLNTLREPPYRERHMALYIPNPMLSAVGLFRTLAGNLGIKDSHALKHADLFDAVQKRIRAVTGGERQSIVIIIDEAQALPEDTLEALRLITNMETETRKLVQIVLSGQPELDTVLEQHRFRQLRQRVTFAHHLEPMGPDDVGHYVNGRLSASGYSGPPLFRGRAIDLLYRYSRGVPRLLNILCHKALLSAYGRGDHRVTTADVREAQRNSPGQWQRPARRFAWWWGLLPLAVIAATLLGLYLAGGMG